MNPTAPKVKIEMIERSLRCFELGLWGLLPLIGLPLAVKAMAERRRVRQISAGQWNPAQHYLSWGVFCAGLAGVLLALEIVIAVAVYIINTTPD